MINNKKRVKKGFTLAEILVSLLVIGGALTIIFGGFNLVQSFNSYAVFESEAAFLAEREIELLKTELLNGKIKGAKGLFNSRFKLKPGWKICCAVNKPDEDHVIKLECFVTRANDEYKLNSFIFLPQNIQEKESL